MQWISEQREAITALTSLGTLLVWVIYLQVFVSSYRRQLRATLLITRGAGDGLESRCLLSNMSSGPIFVESLIVEIETKVEMLVCPVTDRVGQKEASADLHSRTRQGPLLSGETRDLGSFDDLISDAIAGVSLDKHADNLRTELCSIVVEAIGIYGSEELPVGARRRFTVTQERDRSKVRGVGLSTYQVRGRRERRRLLAEVGRDR